MERDVIDGRWIYYSVKEDALQELNDTFGAFFNPGRIQPRRATCGPQGAFTRLEDIRITA